MCCVSKHYGELGVCWTPTLNTHTHTHTHTLITYTHINVYTHRSFTCLLHSLVHKIGLLAEVENLPTYFIANICKNIGGHCIHLNSHNMAENGLPTYNFTAADRSSDIPCRTVADGLQWNICGTLCVSSMVL